MANKMLEITASTHKAIKVQALMRDMTMKAYVDMLVADDKKAIDKKMKG